MSQAHIDHSSRPDDGDEEQVIDGQVIALTSVSSPNYQAYLTITRLVVAGGLLCLVVLIVLMLAVSNFYGLQDAITTGIVISGVAALVGTAGAVSLWTVRRSDTPRQIEHDQQILQTLSSQQALIGFKKRSLSDALASLSASDVSTQIGALSELRVYARQSAQNALTVIPAIESFIRDRVPAASSVNDAESYAKSSTSRPEVQVGVELLGTLPVNVRFNDTRSIRFRLDGLDLREYNFQNLDMSGASLRSSDLSGCIISRARFDGADLRDAALVRSIGNGTSFKRAVLEGTNLQGSLMPDVDFSRALLYRVDLRDAVLVRADFTGTVLVESDLRHADLREAELGEVKARANSIAQSQLRNHGLLRLVDPLDPQADATDTAESRHA